MLLSEITNHFISVVENDGLTNTISFTGIDTIDRNKENLYPLFNMDLITSTVTNGVASTRFLITIVQERNVIPELNNDKIYGTNLIDNLNECHMIGYSFIEAIKRPYIDLSLNTVSDMTFLKDNFVNGLDGVQFTLDVYHNTGSSIPSCT